MIPSKNVADDKTSVSPETELGNRNQQSIHKLDVPQIAGLACPR